MARVAGHIEKEWLHAYAEGDVADPKRAEIQRHIDGCSECQRRMRGVQAMRSVLANAEPVTWDDLKWQRVMRGVQAGLARPGTQQRGRTHMEPGRRWAERYWPAASKAVAVAAIFFFGVFGGWWGRTVRTTGENANVPQVASERGVSGVVGATLETQSNPASFDTYGVSLHLGANSRVQVLAKGPQFVSLELASGELFVTSPHLQGVAIEVRLRTPHFSVVGLPPSFRVAVVGSRSWVEAVDAPLTLFSSKGPDEGVRVQPGARKEFSTEPAATELGPKQDVLPQAALPTPSKVPANRSAGDVERTPAAVESRVGAGNGRTGTIDAPGPTPSPTPNAVTNPESHTTVSIEAPREESPKNTVADRWRAVRTAYEQGDMPRAVALARDLFAVAGDRVEAQLATRILCDGYFALGDVASTVDACARLVAYDIPSEERMRIEMRLAKTYQGVLGNCPQAIERYSSIIVFGGTSTFNEDALLGRAECLVKIGRKADAKADLDRLEALGRRRLKVSRYEALRESILGVDAGPVNK